MANEKVPIRVGLVGLSSRHTGHNSPGFWAASAHLPALQQSPFYEVRGLCNSSLEAAQRAIELHGLDAKKVTAYSDVAAMVADEDVDLVVCCVNVEHHHNIVKPALLARKMVLCEWPLASNFAEMKELAELADEVGVKTAVGLQGRFANSVRAIKARIGGDGERKIGKVLSTNMQVHGVLLGATIPQGLEYFARKDAGGNLLTVRTIHLLDMLVSALGDIDTFTAAAGTQWRTRALVDQNSRCVDPSFSCDTPDHISLQGKLQGGILFSYNLRGGAPFRDTPALDWRIYGDKGEIRVTSTGMSLQMDRNVCIQVEYSGRNTLETIDLAEVLSVDDGTDPARGLDSAARNTARLYHAFATNQVGEEQHLTFSKSLKWAQIIDDVYGSY